MQKIEVSSFKVNVHSLILLLHELPNNLGLTAILRNEKLFKAAYLSFH